MSILSRPAPPPDFTLAYGEHPDHVADVYLPPADRTGQSLPPSPRPDGPLVLLLHGGFWRREYDRTHLGPLATALAGVGYVVALPEYRRTGSPGGGWPGTFDDVGAAVGQLPALVAARLRGDRATLLAGHSAGGQLALWAASAVAKVTVHGVVGLAPVADLRAAYQLDLDRGAAAALLGGGPQRWPERYLAADPMSLVPLGCRVSLVHGGRDLQVPPDFSRRYAEAARAAGDQVTLHTPDADHFDLIDPLSPAWPVVVRAFAEVAGPGRVDGTADSE
jgi:acetyl esterase/lipase